MDSSAPDYIRDYENSIYGIQGALPAAEADRLIADSERAFISSFGITQAGNAVAEPTNEQDDIFE